LKRSNSILKTVARIANPRQLLISFSISKKTKGKFMERKVNGGELNSDLKNWIMDCEFFYLEDIRVKGPDGSISAVEPIKLIFSK
jgi:hypothetical protein